MPISFASEDFTHNYQAIVVGKITNKEIKKRNNLYITEYKLKITKWLYKKPNIKETKYLILKVLGADIPEKSIVIKTSIAPNYIPEKKEAVFLLENDKLKEKNTFTISRGGVIEERGLSDLTPKQIENLFKQIKEM